MPYVSIDRHHVRSYELDSYGHVNNAVYMQWFEHGRSKLLQDRGFNYNNIETRWGVRFVLVSSTVNFRIGLRLEDLVQMATRVSRFGTTSVTFGHTLHRVGQGEALELAADAEATIVFTDPTMRSSRPIPQDFRDLYG